MHCRKKSEHIRHNYKILKPGIQHKVKISWEVFCSIILISVKFETMHFAKALFKMVNMQSKRVKKIHCEKFQLCAVYSALLC